ncbi:PREDICTED: uncharacterized protein LOC109334833 isoform X2 [Lupinus angustifolius]|uniref:uncharacterized protein LOC109334833 isoform X2 n=1 Tax=Lupinus angustifolius TaxID=3871 RepID=UPI00092F5F0E|nr:PREDICTED: uncharacterized protein LOC109334833 isoform X2 [Lupinus angustifolius]
MHKTAELFRNELNRMMDHLYPPRTVVPDGFLHEWWSGCFEFDSFRELVQTNMGFIAGEAPFNMGLTMENLRLGAAHGGDAFQAEQYPTFSRESDSMELDLTGEVALLYFPNLYLERFGNLPQLLFPSSHHEERLTSTLGLHNMANASGQNAESSLQYMSKSESTIMNEDPNLDPDPEIENLLKTFWLLEHRQMEQYVKSTLGESSGNMENLPVHGERYIGINEFADFVSPIRRDDENNIHQLGINRVISE